MIASEKLAKGVELQLPAFLACAIRDAESVDDVWTAIARLRGKAQKYRDTRLKLDRALAGHDKEEMERVSNALSIESASVLTALGGAAVGGTIAAAEQCASGDPTFLSAGIAGLVAVTQKLIVSPVSRQVVWRFRRPYLLWMTNVVDEAERLTEAWPEVERLWRIPEKQEGRFIEGFGNFARLQSL